MTNRGGGDVEFAGWQRRDRPGRRVVITANPAGAPSVPNVLPALEIRVGRPDQSFKVIGF